MPELRIGCIDTPAAAFLPRLFQRLRDNVRSFSIASGLCGQLRELVLARRLEMLRSFAFDATDTVMTMVAEEMGWSLLPPTTLVKSRQHLNHMRVLPLPTSGFRRSIHLVARKGELGSLPANIHKAGCAVIKQGYLTDVFAISPWLKPMIRR